MCETAARCVNNHPEFKKKRRESIYEKERQGQKWENIFHKQKESMQNKTKSPFVTISTAIVLQDIESIYAC